jgi:alpha-tubulin suppressor-like RCC1 family protein
VFPFSNKEKQMSEEVIQILAHRNCSFALCKSGAIYSWGQNEHGGLLGRGVDPNKTLEPQDLTKRILNGITVNSRSDMPGLVPIPVNFKI